MGAFDPGRVNVIVGARRSGTTVFRGLLEAAGCRNCDEILHGNVDARQPRFYRFVAERAGADRRLIHPRRHRALFEAFIAQLVETSARPLAIDVKHEALGLIPHSDWTAPRPWLADFWRENARRVFVVTRRDTLRRLVSLRMAQATGVWAKTKANPHAGAEKPRLTLDSGALVAELDRLARQDAALEGAFEGAGNVVRLAYEDLFGADGRFTPETVAAATLPGGEPPDAAPRHGRLNPEPLDALIANMGAVRQALNGTPYAGMAG